MAEQVFGLGVNQVMAYAAVANVLLVVVLAGINVYYAVHAKRQADASREQVAVFTRQAEIAAETLSFLRKQIDQQVRTDVAAVALQLKVAIHVIEDWLKRIASDKHLQLPDEIVILPGDFNIATQRAHSIEDPAHAGSGLPGGERGAGKGCQEPECGPLQALRGPHPLGSAGRAGVLTAGTAAAHNYGLGSPWLSG